MHAVPATAAYHFQAAHVTFAHAPVHHHRGAAVSKELNGAFTATPGNLMGQYGIPANSIRTYTGMDIPYELANSGYVNPACIKKPSGSWTLQQAEGQPGNTPSRALDHPSQRLCQSDVTPKQIYHGPNSWSVRDEQETEPPQRDFTEDQSIYGAAALYESFGPDLT